MRRTQFEGVPEQAFWAFLVPNVYLGVKKKVLNFSIIFIHDISQDLKCVTLLLNEETRLFLTL